MQVDSESFKRTYVIDETITYPVGMFVRGEEYKLWGLFTLDLHLIGAAQFGDPVHLIGTDRLGRDVLSRTIYGTRVSMSVGLVGVGLSLLFWRNIRWHIRLLWRRHRQLDPANHRDSALSADDSALDGLVRSHPAHLAAFARLFCHHPCFCR